MKKDKLANLVNGFLNEDGQNQEQNQERGASSTPQGDLSQEQAEALGITPEMQEAINALRKKGVGRPKRRKNGNPKEREARATFIVDPTLIRKVKYIALAETRLYKNVVKDVFASYVEEWERKNGRINLPNGTEL